MRNLETSLSVLNDSVSGWRRRRRRRRGRGRERLQGRRRAAAAKAKSAVAGGMQFRLSSPRAVPNFEVDHLDIGHM